MTSKSWEQMAIDVIAYGRPADLAQAAAGWETFRRRLLDLQHLLDRDVRSVAGTWKGSAADAFQTHMATITADLQAVVDSLSQGEGVVESLRSTSHALAQAQQQMPVPVGAVHELMQARNLQATISVGSFSVIAKPDFYGKPPVEASAALADFVNNRTDEARAVYNMLNTTVADHAARLPEPLPPGIARNVPTVPPPDLQDPGVDGNHTDMPDTGPGGSASGRAADPSLISAADAAGATSPTTTDGPGGVGTGLAGAAPAGSHTAASGGLATAGLAPTGSAGVPGSPGGGTTSHLGAALTRPSGGGYLGKPVSGAPTSAADRSDAAGRPVTSSRSATTPAPQTAATAGLGTAGKRDGDKKHRSTWLLEDDGVWAPREAPGIDVLGLTPPEEPTASDGPEGDGSDTEPIADFLLGGRRISDTDNDPDDPSLVRAPRTSRTTAGSA